MIFGIAAIMPYPAVPTVQRVYGVESVDAAWLVTAFLLTASVSTPVCCRMGDMRGKRPMLIGSLLLFALGAVVAAAGETFAALVVGRCVQGLGGGMIPLAIGIVRDERPPERVAAATGWITATVGAGNGLGLVLGGVLVGALGISGPFWVLAVASLVVAWLVWWQGSPVAIATAGRIDVAGAALMSVGLLTVLLAISRGSLWGWTSARTLGLLTVGLVAWIAWLLWEMRAPTPLVDLRVLSDRAVMATNIGTFAFGFSVFGCFFLVPLLVETPASAGYGFGATVAASGVFLLPSSVAMLVAGGFTGWLEARLGARVPLLVGGALTAAGGAWLAVAHATELDVYVGMSIVGLGVGLGLSGIANVLIESVPAGHTATAVGVNTITRTTGGALGAQVAAALVAAGAAREFAPDTAYVLAFAVSACAGVIGLGAAAFIPRRGRLPHSLRSRAAEAS